MSKMRGLRAAAGIGAAVVVVAGAVALGVHLSGGRAPVPESEAPAAITVAPAPQIQGPTVAAPEAEPDVFAAPEVSAAPKPAPPALDTFRLEADGRMVVAGRAVPGGSVAILVDEAQLALAQGDAAGKFVAFLDLPPSEYPSCARGFIDPEAVSFDQRVGGLQELAHDGDDGDLCGFSG
ncbi:MAG: hypothetical protein H5U16_12240, partial [Roseovarius sp.]|nr:hypothetical protein [Roseovarius sp.]